MADVIPFDQRDGSLWYDGKLVPWKSAQTHVQFRKLEVQELPPDGPFKNGPFKDGPFIDRPPEARPQ